MTRIYFVRHGETEWNASLRYQGHADIPLGDAGIAQARALSERLKTVKFAGCYASDLSRALQTAEIIAEPHGLVVQSLPQLRETHFGVWEGLTYNQIVDQYPEHMRNWQSDPVSTVIPGGESLGDVAERVNQGLAMVLKQHQEGNVLVAAHGGTIRIILATILGMDLSHYWKLRQDNTAVNIVDFYDERAIVMTINDIHHLDQ